ncbi:glycosyltransferase family 1 protein [Ramaria rubella]|nr:glycosyltransferase family 1 protein [Ramaria rubella]
MSQINKFSGHILLLAVPGWGHLRPLSALACKIVKERSDIAVTLFTAGAFGQRVEREVSRYFLGDADENRQSNIRLVNIGGEGFEFFEIFPLLHTAFVDYYGKLINSEPIRCQGTGRTHDAILPPTVAIIDFFLLDILRAIRATTGTRVPILAWQSTYSSYTLRLLAPETFGGLGDIAKKARTLAEETGRPVEEITHERGDVVNVPGLPPMYDWEYFPQEERTELSIKDDIHSTAQIFARECDGFVAVSSMAYEAESLRAMRIWLAETNRPMYAVGPLMPPGAGDKGLSAISQQKEIEISANGDQFQSFLDRMLKVHGEKSIIYISFGSIFWPEKSEHVWIFIQALIEFRVPFILSYASSKASIPSKIARKIEESGLGMMSTWSPQQTILNHANSVTEAVAQGTPLIAWPMEVDQPATAAHLTLVLDVAFEMLEVRTGPGLKPLWRGIQPVGTDEAVTAEARNVIRGTRSPEGVRKRKKAEALRDRLKKEWEEGGASLSNLRELLTDVCPK